MNPTALAVPLDAGDRRVPLSGAVNCRDLGGYQTGDGRRVRWGRLLRSDALSELSEVDLTRLAAAGLRTVCDLRSDEERAHKPNRRLYGAVQVHEIGFMPHRGEELLALTREGKISIAEIEARVREVYRRFVTDQAASYARLLQLIDGQSVPLLFHCTSGRDRTGFASAVLLLALGVRRSSIVDDYVLSDHYRRDLRFQVGSDVDAAIMAALTQSHPEYLATSFRAIDEHWGSDAAYLRGALGLSEQRQRALQTLLLEPADASVARTANTHSPQRTPGS